MNKKELLTSSSDLKKLYIGGAVLLIIGIAVILILFSGSAHTEIKSLTYNDDNLTAVYTYDGDDPHKVWIQYKVLRVNNIFSTTEVIPMTSCIDTLVKGENVSSIPAKLSPGEYKIFIYIVDFEDMTNRLAGFIRYLEVI